MSKVVTQKPGSTQRMIQLDLSDGWFGESMPPLAKQRWSAAKLRMEIKHQLPTGVEVDWLLCRHGAALYRVTVPSSVSGDKLEALRVQLAQDSGWKVAFDSLVVGEGIDRVKVSQLLRAHPWPDDFKGLDLRGSELLVHTANLHRFNGRKDRSLNKIRAVFPDLTIVPLCWIDPEASLHLKHVHEALCNHKNIERIRDQVTLMIPKEFCVRGVIVEPRTPTIRIEYGSAKVTSEALELVRRTIEFKTGQRAYFHRRIDYSGAIDYVRQQLPTELSTARIRKLNSKISSVIGVPRPCIIVGCQVALQERGKFKQFIERISNELPVPIRGRFSVCDASVKDLVHQKVPLSWNLRRLSFYEENGIAVLRCAKKVPAEGIAIVEELAEQLGVPVLLNGVTHRQVIPEVAAKVQELIPKEAGVTGICKYIDQNLHVIFISNPLISFDREAVRALLGGELFVLPAKADVIPGTTLQSVSTPTKKQARPQENKAVVKSVGQIIDSGTLRGFGGCEEIGRSSFLLNVSGKNILLDCGVGFGRDPFPTIPPAVARIIDAVILTHAHTDHSGYLPWLYSQGCKAPIYMTAPTFELAQMLVRDFVTVSEKYKQAKLPFEWKHIGQAFAHAELVKFDERIELGSSTYLSFLNAGHIPGSAMALIEDTKRILYTGDIRCEDSRLLLGAKLPTDIDHLIMDTTYGDRTQEKRALSEQRFLELVDHTLRTGGTVLIPSFAVGRAQEILGLLSMNPEIGPHGRFPLYVTGMINSVNNVVLDYMSRIENENVYLNPAMAMLRGKELAAIRGAFSMPQARTVATVSDGRPKVILSTSGMCEGPAAEYLRFVSQDSKNLVVLVGYQAEGTIGRTLQDGVSPIMLGETPYTIRSRIETIGLSGHADSEQLIRQLSVARPKNVIAVHSTAETIKGFKAALATKLPSLQVKAARLGQEMNLS